MTILKSLVAAPLLIYGVTVCSPVFAETVINNEITPVMSPAAKKALKEAEKASSGPVTVVHRIKWGDLQRVHLQGCPGGVEYGCESNNTYGNVKNTFEMTE